MLGELQDFPSRIAEATRARYDAEEAYRRATDQLSLHEAGLKAEAAQRKDLSNETMRRAWVASAMQEGEADRIARRVQEARDRLEAARIEEERVRNAFSVAKIIARARIADHALHDRE